MIYTENDFVFKNDNLDNILSFIKEYKKEEIPGLRNEATRLFDISKRTEKGEYSQKSGFTFYYDKKCEEYNVIIKNVYDTCNLLSVLFDYVIDDTDLSAEKEIALKHKVIDSYLNKIMKEENIDLKKEIASLKKLVKDQVTVLKNYYENDLDEDQSEDIADIIDKEYYEPISDIFGDMIDMFVSRHIKIDKVEENEKL